MKIERDADEPDRLHITIPDPRPDSSDLSAMRAAVRAGASTGETYPRVVCGDCGARGPRARSDANREAIANWNRRPGLR